MNVDNAHGYELVFAVTAVAVADCLFVNGVHRIVFDVINYFSQLEIKINKKPNNEFKFIFCAYRKQCSVNWIYEMFRLSRNSNRILYLLLLLPLLCVCDQHLFLKYCCIVNYILLNPFPRCHTVTTEEKKNTHKIRIENTKKMKDEGGT